MSRIFISYRRQDSEGYVGRIYDHLVQHFERDDVFMDVDTIKPGADFIQTIEDEVADCVAFVAVIGPQWLIIADEAGERRIDQWNDYVRLEVMNAIKQKKLIIPVLVGQGRMPSPQDLPDDLSALARRNAIELSHQRFAYDIERLIQTLREALTQKPAVKKSAAGASKKEAALKALRAELVGAVDSPLYQYRNDNRHFPVLGDGSADAEILLIGEAPGINEAKRGIPFCGASGEVLEEMLNEIGLKRKDVYTTNLLLDYPGKRDPLPEEIEFYTSFVDRIIEIIQPQVIVPLGGYASSYLLKKLDLPEKGNKISAIHGKLIKTKMPYGEIHVVPMYHPAFVLYTAGRREELRNDFRKLKLFL